MVSLILTFGLLNLIHLAIAKLMKVTGGKCRTEYRIYIVTKLCAASTCHFIFFSGRSSFFIIYSMILFFLVLQRDKLFRSKWSPWGKNKPGKTIAKKLCYLLGLISELWFFGMTAWLPNNSLFKGCWHKWITLYMCEWDSLRKPKCVAILILLVLQTKIFQIHSFQTRNEWYFW